MHKIKIDQPKSRSLSNNPYRIRIYLFYILLIIILQYIIGCSGTEAGTNGTNGSSCSVEAASNGALILCTDGTNVLITNGTNGQDGMDGLPGLDGRNGTDSIAELIDPCGDNPGQFDEIILKLSTGELLVYFESGSNRFLSLIDNGSYHTTDSQHCAFSVNNGIITF
jgi:hypothetical protein